ncbi:MAG: transcriptional repressor [Sedimentisphaerales bacterium]|jgi:Fur family ferric uptake transcriptional regulator
MKSQLKERIDNLLDSVKMKRTGPRRTILEILLAGNRPQTADEIVSSIGKIGPNRVTVYRTLESMVDAGLVHKAFVEERSQHYELADKCTEHQCHPHFVCTGCGRTSCLHDVSVSMATSTPVGFIIQRQQVRLEGLCPKCA